MPPEQFIIGASAAIAVALLAKPTLSRAVKTVASHHCKNVDDYPPQKPSRFHFVDNTTECSYGNGLVRGEHIALLKGFPQPQTRGTYFDGVKKVAQCFYTDALADSPTLFLWVKEDGLATSNINCPKTEANNASRMR
ncbi:hypothetical protein FOZ61_002175 [Perkinsus olseni]|uniref:Uncharacterized protein n=1 Tax=Perkinsus olseni TaxID=32597 RepID=A0A7J6KNQ2_PEROL|nr:hypothetical protein FOZ61_002175 [Perkinsus olseni]